MKERLVRIIKTLVGVYRHRFYLFLAVLFFLSAFLLFILVTVAFFWVESGYRPEYVSFYWAARAVVPDQDKFYNIPIFWVGSWDWVLYGSLHFIGETMLFSILLGMYMSLSIYYRRVIGCTAYRAFEKKGAAGILASVGASGVSIMPIALSMVGCCTTTYAFATVMVLGFAITSSIVTYASRIFILAAVFFLLWSIFDIGDRIRKAQRDAA